MNKRNAVLGIVAAGLLGLGLWGAHRAAFDWHSLGLQLRSAAVVPILLATACIYFTFWVRAVRWRVLLGASSGVGSAALVAPQFVGFSAVSLFGRLADLTRPYLIARRTGLPVASQVAVYSIERIFDLAAAAVLFSVTLALAPRGLPHHEAFARAGILSLAGTLLLAAFALTVRFAGDWLAGTAERVLRPAGAGLAGKVAARVLEFRDGMRLLRTAGEMASVMGLSLLIWLAIAECYVLSAHAFRGTPQLAGLSWTQTMLLMATSMGGSLVQLPVVGWFTQIALLAAAIHAFFGAPLEAATACGAVLLFTTTLSIVPAGAVAARMSGTSLRGAARTSAETA